MTPLIVEKMDLAGATVVVASRAFGSFGPDRSRRGNFKTTANATKWGNRADAKLRKFD